MPRSYASIVIDADPDDVWRCLRNFDGTPDYLDLVATSEISDGRQADQIGCQRVMVLTDESVVKETLIGIDDERRQLRYHLTEGPFRFSNYYATVQVSPVTASGATFVAWSSHYDCEQADADANDELLARVIYSPGLARVKDMFERLPH